MAIHITCPSCRSEAAVDDSLAGKDVLCPHCRGRITVPSLVAGEPAERSGPAWEDSAFSARESLPRYRGADDRGDGDYAPVRDSRAAWDTTLTGLGLMFWSGAILAGLTTVTNLLTMLLGQNPQQFGMGGMGAGGAGGAAPNPAMMAFAMWSMVAGCGMLILAVTSFVGMCMCCTAPPESGTRGKAIAAVVGTVLYVVGAIMVVVASTVVAFNQIREMGAPQPGQMPFSPGVFLTMMGAAAVGSLILVALWMMFHKAVAEHFRNTGLARASVLYTIAFIGFTLIAQVLNLIANPQMLEGNLLAPPPSPVLALLSQAWGLIGLVGLSVWFLVIVRATRRTILGTNVETTDE